MKMKQFEEEIQITISVDSIAGMLLATMSPDAKHRELITESIIGRMLANDKSGLSFIYNSLHGHECKVNFEVGDIVLPTKLTAYGYWTPESIAEGNACYGRVERATVIKIDEYSDKKLMVEFDVPTKNGSMRTSQDWITHTLCSRVPADKAEAGTPADEKADMIL